MGNTPSQTPSGTPVPATGEEERRERVERCAGAADPTGLEGRSLAARLRRRSLPAPAAAVVAKETDDAAEEKEDEKEAAAASGSLSLLSASAPSTTPSLFNLNMNMRFSTNTHAGLPMGERATRNTTGSGLPAKSILLNHNNNHAKTPVASPIPPPSHLSVPGDSHIPAMRAPSPSTTGAFSLMTNISNALKASIPSPSPAPSDPSFAAASATLAIAPNAPALDLDACIARLLDARHRRASKSFCLKNAVVLAICHAVREVLMDQAVLLEVEAPVNLVGDVHGQFEDLLRTFDRCGYPPNANYLFLGDYVDRGKFSLETILLLFCYKLKYPLNFFILRGNHECASVNRVYGFYDECKRRCNLKIWKVFTDVFNCLPIAAIVAGKIFCVHGGLSPSLISMDYIRAIPRPSEVPEFGLLNDLLWSDPSATAVDWEDNDRGVSYCFGPKIVHDFVAKYNFDLVARAHMVVEGGYEFFADRQLVTIFSAPNYCGEFDNKGAIMCVDDNLLCSFEILEPQFTKRGAPRRTSQMFKGAGGG